MGDVLQDGLAQGVGDLAARVAEAGREIDLDAVQRASRPGNRGEMKPRRAGVCVEDRAGEVEGGRISAGVVDASPRPRS